jgi:two-component system, chemotaxis family, chemotaxis protein CheY
VRLVRVLFVDPDLDSRESARTQLTAAGFQVLSAANGVEALSLLDALVVDVVVTEIYMPDEDGIELIQALRRRRPKLPVVAITDDGPRRDRAMLRVAAALGAGAMLHKPFSADELVAVIRRLVEIAE